MQLTIDYVAAEALPVAPAQVASAARLPRQRPEPGEIVLRLCQDGTLDFLNQTRLPPGVKEAKVARKNIKGRPAWLPRGK